MARTFTSSKYCYRTANPPVTTIPCTISAWVRGTTGQSIYPVNIQNSDNTSYIALIADISVSGGIYGQINAGGGSSDAVQILTSLAASTWYHACFVISSDTVRNVFLNGGNKTAGSGASVEPTGLTHTGINGNYSGSWSGLGDGTIADIAVWDVALTDAEVLALARGVSPALIRPSGLKAFWPLESGDGYLQNRVRDGASYALTLGGTAPVAAEHAPTMPPFAGLGGWRGVSSAVTSHPGAAVLSAAGALAASARQLAAARAALAPTAGLASAAMAFRPGTARLSPAAGIAASAAALRPATARLAAAGSLLANAHIEGYVWDGSALFAGAGLLRASAAALKPIELLLEPAGALLADALAQQIIDAVPVFGALGALSADTVHVIGPPYVGSVEERLHPEYDVHLVTHWNAQMELRMASGTLIGRTTSDRGDAEAITIQSPLRLEDGKLTIDIDALRTLLGL